MAPQYKAPFSLYSDIEGTAYMHLADKSISAPRYFDWNVLKSLCIYDQVVAYLKVLGLEKYARLDYIGYERLCLEFFSTIVLYDGRQSLSCRMMGREFTVIMQQMKQIFGFPTSGAHEKPLGFDT